MVFWKRGRDEMNDLTQQEFQELTELLELVYAEEESEEKRLERALRSARQRIKDDEETIRVLRLNLEFEIEIVNDLAREADLLLSELAECRLDNPTGAVKGTLKFIDQGGNIVANTVSLNVAQTVVATVDWVDARGNVALAPTNVSVVTDAGVSAVVNVDGTITVTPVGPLGDNVVTVSGDGIVNPATGTVSVVAGPAETGTLNFGTPA